MPHTDQENIAKLFMNGRSQAVRLPAQFRFDDCDSVFIRRDKKTGDVIISKRPATWEGFFELAQSCKEETQDFLSDRDNPIESEKDLF